MDFDLGIGGGNDEPLPCQYLGDLGANGAAIQGKTLCRPPFDDRQFAGSSSVKTVPSVVPMRTSVVAGATNPVPGSRVIPFVNARRVAPSPMTTAAPYNASADIGPGEADAEVPPETVPAETAPPVGLLETVKAR